MKFEDEVLATLQNYQVMPSRTRVEINDKTAKVVFNIKTNNYKALLKGVARRIVEKKKHPKWGEITAPFTIQNEEGYDDITPLTEFERDVLSACISEWTNGNRYTTTNIIFRALVGKVGEEGVTPSKDQETAILKAIDKLMFTRFNKMFAQAYALLNYDTAGIQIEESALLPSCIINAKINGQPCRVIFFDRESPLLTHANIKNQIVRYDAHLLDVPNMNNTPKIIAIKNYVLRRINEIKLHKQLAPTLRFDTIFKNCRIDNASRKVKAAARDIIFRFFEHLKNEGFIDGYTVNQNKFGNKYHSISFTYTPPKKESADDSAEKVSNDAAKNDGYSNCGTGYSNSGTGYSNSGTSYSNYGTRPKKRKCKKSKKQ